MKNKKIFKTFSALCLAVVDGGGLHGPGLCPRHRPVSGGGRHQRCQRGGGGNQDSPALTPEGNAALVDDFGGNKQLITVTTKAGNYFYILIDRANEDKETAVHFFEPGGRCRPASSVGGRPGCGRSTRHLYLHG